jgi:hypothetical protein
MPFGMMNNMSSQYPPDFSCSYLGDRIDRARGVIRKLRGI